MRQKYLIIWSAIKALSIQKHIRMLKNHLYLFCFKCLQADEGDVVELDLTQLDFGDRGCDEERIEVFKGLAGRKYYTVYCPVPGFIQFRVTWFFPANYTSTVRFKNHSYVGSCRIIIPLYVREGRYSNVTCFIKIISFFTYDPSDKGLFCTCVSIC